MKSKQAIVKTKKKKEKKKKSRKERVVGERNRGVDREGNVSKFLNMCCDTSEIRLLYR